MLSFEDDEDQIISAILSVLDMKTVCSSKKMMLSTKVKQGDITILSDKRQVLKKDKRIETTFFEFEIINLLIRNPGRVFSKEQIYALRWDEPYFGDYNVIMQHIRNIREKIEDDPSHPVYIQTVRGVGYRFNGNLGSE